MERTGSIALVFISPGPEPESREDDSFLCSPLSFGPAALPSGGAAFSGAGAKGER